MEREVAYCRHCRFRITRGSPADPWRDNWYDVRAAEFCPHNRAGVEAPHEPKED